MCVGIMAFKRAFLLIEFLISFFVFTLTTTMFFYLQFNILQLKDLAVKRLIGLNEAINAIESEKGQHFVKQGAGPNLEVKRLIFKRGKEKKSIDISLVKVHGTSLGNRRFEIKVMGMS